MPTSIHNNGFFKRSLKVLIVSVMLYPLTAVMGANTADSDPTISNQTSCTGTVAAPTKLNLPLGKSTLINLPLTLNTRTVGNQGIVQTKLITPQTLYVLGLDIGATNMILQSKNGQCAIIDVAVTLDPDALQQMLAEVLPTEPHIRVRAASDSIVLTGYVEDALSAARAVEIAEAYVRRLVAPVNTGEANQQQRQQSSIQLQGGGKMP